MTRFKASKLVRLFIPTLVAVLIISIFVEPISGRAASARQTGITFSETTFENKFPQSLTFKVHVTSQGATITAARLFFYGRNSSSKERVDLEIQPGAELDLVYEWDTSRYDLVPSEPLFYQWEVDDSAGNTTKSNEALFYYDDVNHDWQVLEKENYAVWWHDRPQEFGSRVLLTMQVAMQKQQELFGLSLEYPIRIIIYNTPEEFQAWHNSTRTDLIGGQAFPELGITTQIVEDDVYQDAWINDVVPHEISHLYFYQVTHHPLAETPAWLNEGVAQYNEFDDNSYDLEYARTAILDGGYIPLGGLTGSFGYANEEKFRLSYYESLSAVTYLIETYSKRGLADLLAAYKNGKITEQAFPAALGVTFGQFERDWLTWLGVPPDMYPTALPTATIVSMVDHMTMAVQTAQARKAGTPVPATPTPHYVTVTPAPASGPAGLPPNAGIFAVLAAAVCCSITLLAAFGILFWTRRRKNQKNIPPSQES